MFVSKSLLEQGKSVLPVCLFLMGFQVIVLGQEVKQYKELLLGLLLAVVGLALFTFGLLNGLMPMGERIGLRLPSILPLSSVLFIAAILGVAVTLAEPALGVVKTAGSLIQPQHAPNLHALLHSRQDLLVLAVAAGVGLSSSLGMLRIRRSWSLKWIVIVLVLLTISLSMYVYYRTSKHDVIGLAWDLGAVTTGPVTVPLVIALGLGVATAGNNPSPLTGFGVVTFASLIPVITVLLLALSLPSNILEELEASTNSPSFPSLQKGANEPSSSSSSSSLWYDQTPYAEIIAGVTLELTPGSSVIFKASAALLAAQIGIIVFNVGLTQGLSKLGTMVGGVMPSAFTSMEEIKGSPIWGRELGTFIAVLFAWVLGFGATLAEPALFTLAVTVDRLSRGKITQRQVVLSVALGVGTGTALGLLKIVIGFPLLPLLLVGYTLAVILTTMAGEILICVAWDSAGVTTGPVTVPLVISLGLGLGRALNAADGFGILSLASVCPIISVLAVGIIKGDGQADRRHGDVEARGEYELSRTDAEEAGDDD
ncbi:hypothetical protein GUITHDRAFT_136128 [Guillardia theta CCMP2712]|uniref:DUF1538 domain-containing protein n=1 Tax=Guillardia theta (strain CCMP2712) TaxID=905079 RepID=L1JM37_GUITC|nr:hypothetical protein GUITHDRAFT_136128 [Guillardia theta CCMP2712]EKX49467.1 hypothetical protein GUITHDRAFT_136128 [Guillardia theta CCMP2712]|eukprot:XP_005836447.1 hypothetical protein GUITHDRAFT_136128 [Guillardia theta CCMP2712]